MHKKLPREFDVAGIDAEELLGILNNALKEDEARRTRQQMLRQKSGLELTLVASADAIGAVNATASILRQRSVLYNNSLGVKENLGMAMILASTLLSLRATVPEIVYRVKTGQSLVSTSGEPGSDQLIKTLIGSLAITLSTLSLGRLPFTNRVLTSYGRRSMSVMSAISATRLALNVRSRRA